MICETCRKYVDSKCTEKILMPGIASMTREDILSEDNCPYFESRPYVRTKPEIGCSPYYVHISSRICELCEAIKRYSTYENKHDKIKLWAYEIMILNEADRNLRHQAKQKVFFEEDMK